MNILLVTNGFPPTAYGGVEVYTYDLAMGLARRGHQVHVFCRESNFDKPDYELIHETTNGIEVIRIVNDYKKLTDFQNTYLDEQIDDVFSRLSKDIAPQLIHFNHLIALSARLPRIASDLRINSIATLHDFWPICHRVNLINREQQICPGPFQGGMCAPCVLGIGPLPRSNQLILFTKRITTPGFRRWVRQTMGIFDPQRRPIVKVPQSVDIFAERHAYFKESLLTANRLLVPSNYIKKKFAGNGYPNQRLEVVPLGININRKGHTSDIKNRNTVRLAFIGSIIPIKGVNVLISAFKQVNVGNLSLRIFGREDIEPRNYIQDLKLLSKDDPRIEFMGPFSPEQRVDIFSNIDALIIPSIVPETFSLVAREALALGIPVIASDIGALPEIVIDRVNGFLFEPGNEQALAKILKKISDDQSILSNLICPGPVPITTIEEHVEQVEWIYQEVIKQ